MIEIIIQSTLTKSVFVSTPSISMAQKGAIIDFDLIHSRCRAENKKIVSFPQQNGSIALSRHQQ